MRATPALLVLAVAGCHRARPASDEPAPKPADDRPGTVMPIAALVGPEWTLSTLGGQNAAVGNRGKALTLRLTTDGVAAGFSGCNHFTGKFTNAPTSLRLKSLATTKMSCTRGMTLEREYLDVLGKVEGWRVNGGELQLLANGEPIAVYRKN